MRKAAKNDLYFLAKYILNFWWLCWYPHKAFAERIQKNENKSLFLLPRGHCKTYLFNIADTIQSYFNAPDVPIAIFCDNSKRAKWKIRPIRQQFENNPLLYKLFPEICYKNPRKEARRKNLKWGDDELFLPGHPGVGQEPSVGVYGLDTMPTSLHFPKIKGDDLVVPETVTTSTQIKKNIAAYGLVRSSILSPGGNIQICGTIYDDGDLHRAMEDSGEYAVYKRPAEWTDRQTGKRKTLWPVQYPGDHLDKIKSDPAVGLYIYSCQYLLDPAPEGEHSFFQLGNFGRYTKLPRLKRVFAAADLAISESEDACDTAIVVGFLDKDNELYIAEVRYGHWDSLKIISEIIDVQAIYSPEIFHIEAENIQRTIMPFLKQKMRESGIFPNVEAWVPRGDKVAKARPLQGRSREGAVKLPAKGGSAPDWLFETELQLRRFPKAAKKDIADAMSLLVQGIDKMWAPKNENTKRAEDEYVSLDL